MRTRKRVNKLRWACWLDERPEFIPAPHGHTDATSAGLVFERKVARWLAAQYGERVHHNPWFQYQDSRGMGWCSPDIVLMPEGDEPILILECKLTVTRDAKKKLSGIYVPVLEKCLGNTHIKGLQVSKNLKQGWKGEIIDSVEEAHKMRNKYATTIMRNL